MASVGYALHMYRIIIILMCISFSFSVTAKTVYKTTNPDGSISFTDQETNASEKIEVRKAQTFPAQPVPSLNLPSKKSAPAFAYTLTISQPEENATIINTSEVLVSLIISPELKPGYKHQIRYQLGDQSIVSEKTNETFKNVSRGTHTITVSITNTDGEVISPVVSRTFHVKRFFKKQ